jgi:hypothetical protein
VEDEVAAVARVLPPPAEDGAGEQEGVGGHGRDEAAVGGAAGEGGEAGEDGADVGGGGLELAGLLQSGRSIEKMK